MIDVNCLRSSVNDWRSFSRTTKPREVKEAKYEATTEACVANDLSEDQPIKREDMKSGRTR
jgi:hypothetical protein